MGKFLKFALLAIMFVGVTSAQEVSLKVASDSSSGTYSKMLGEVVQACSSDQFQIQAAGNHGGAVGNLDALFNNQADAAFLHSDVFYASAQSDPAYQRLKTLVALWPEPIHVLALRVSKTKKQGTFSFGTVEINSLADTAGYSVGAAGGGVITGHILQVAGKFQVIDEQTGDQVINALRSGEIAAAIFVGAAPLPNLQKIAQSGEFKLIPIGESITNQVSAVYRPAKVNYPGLTNGPVSTLAPVAVLLTKPFQTPTKQNAQRALRQCFADHLAELQDSGSRNWAEVTANDEGTLNNYLQLPAATRKK